jgi:hypothetical protein
MQTRKDIRNFYIDETFLPIWEEFKQICAREGDSASEKIREFIERYVIVHSSGNPQLRIDKFTDIVAKKSCFFCQGHFNHLYKVEYVSGLIAPTCKDCLDKNKAKGTFSTVKKILGLIK